MKTEHYVCHSGVSKDFSSNHEGKELKNYTSPKYFIFQKMNLQATDLKNLLNTCLTKELKYRSQKEFLEINILWKTIQKT